MLSGRITRGNRDGPVSFNPDAALKAEKREKLVLSLHTFIIALHQETFSVDKSAELL